MQRILLVLVVALAIVGGAIAAVPSLRAHVLGVPLRLEWKVGQEQRVKSTVEGKVKIDVAGLSPGMLPPMAQNAIGQDIPFKVESTSRQVVKAVDAAGVADLEVTPEGGSVEVSFEGKAHRETFGKSAPSTFRMDPRGHIVAGEPSAASQDRLAQEVLSNITSGFLPGDQRRPGNSWQQEIHAPFEVKGMKLAMDGKVDNRFVGVEVRDGQPTADILSTYDIQVGVVPAGATSAPPGLSLKGSLKGSGNNYFDWRQSRTSGSTGQGLLDMTLGMQLPVVGSVGGSAHLVGSFTLRMEKL